MNRYLLAVPVAALLLALGLGACSSVLPEGSTPEEEYTFRDATFVRGLDDLPEPSEENAWQLYYVADVDTFYYSDGTQYVPIEIPDAPAIWTLNLLDGEPNNESNPSAWGWQDERFEAGHTYEVWVTDEEFWSWRGVSSERIEIRDGEMWLWLVGLYDHDYATAVLTVFKW